MNAAADSDRRALGPPSRPTSETSPFRLVVRDQGAESGYRLDLGDHRIGSHRDHSDLVLAATGVSRCHALLRVTPTEVLIQDLGSKNGTYVNGDRLQKPHSLLPGQRVGIGRLSLWMEPLDLEDLELALELAEVGSGWGRSPSELAAESSQTTCIRLPRSGTDRQLEAYERCVDRACQGVGGDVQGALHSLVSGLGVAGLWLLELDEGEAIVVAAADTGVANLGDLPAAAATDYLLQLERQAAEDGRAGHCVGCRQAGNRPWAGALSFHPEGSLALVAVGGEESDGALELMLRVVVRILALRRLPRPLSSGATAKPASRSHRRLQFPAGHCPGVSAAMGELYSQLMPLLDSDLPVLVQGETGVGKECVARLLHASSGRSDQPLVAINCAAIPADLLEAELFGIEEGVATGVSARPGRFRQADGGTLFLDEIGDMEAPLQAKLLRALQESEVQPVGGVAREVDVRVVSSTNADLRRKAEAGEFRLDLYYRLAGFTLAVPALRQCPEDVPCLVHHFLDAYSQQALHPVRGLTVKALRALCAYHWPGNVRELKHEIHRLVYACGPGQPIDSSMLAPHIRHPSSSLGPGGQEPKIQTSSLNLAALERQTIVMALERCEGKLARAATLLGISRDALRRRLERHQLQPH